MPQPSAEPVRDTRDNGARALALTLICTGFFFLLAYLVLGLSLVDDTATIARAGTLQWYWFTYLQDWSPLYSAWFLGLERIFHDRYTLYFASWSILAGAVVLIPTALRVRRAWLYTIAVLAFPLLFAGPYSGLLGACFVLFGLCLLLRFRASSAVAAFILGVISYPLSFARPEFNYCVLLALPLATVLFACQVWASRKDPTRLRTIVTAIACILVLCTLAASTRNIMRHSVRPRSGLAFAQHFAYRAWQAGEPVPAGDFENSDFAARKFGIALDSRGYYGLTIADFFHANHRLFLRHALRNLCTPAIPILLVVWAFVLLLPWCRSQDTPLRAASLYVFIMSLPSFGGLILIYPREHYAAVFLPALLLLVTQLDVFQNWAAPRLLPTLAIVFPLMAVTYFLLPQHIYFVFPADKIDRARIACIRRAEAPLPSGGAAFNALGGNDYPGDPYLQPRTFASQAALPTLPSFQSWITTQHPVWIAVTAGTSSSYGISTAEMQGLLVDTLHYTPYNCPSAANMRLYTRTR